MDSRASLRSFRLEKTTHRFVVRVSNKIKDVTKTHSPKRFKAQTAKSAETYPMRYVEHFLTAATKKLEGI